jgi:hypothetical protein
MPLAGAARPAAQDDFHNNDLHAETFHSVMERHSAEGNEPARTASPSERSQSIKPKPDASAKEADRTQDAVNTTDSNTPEPEAKAKPIPAGPINLSADSEPNAPTSEAVSAEDDASAAFLAVTDGVQVLPSSSSAVASNGGQRTLNPGTGVSVAARQHQGTPSTTETATENPNSVSTLNLSALESAGESEGTTAASAQTATASAPGSAQANSTDDGRLDSQGLRIEVSTSTGSNASDALAFEAKLTPAPNSTATPVTAFQQSFSQSMQPAEQLASKPSPVASPSEPLEPAVSPSKTQALFEVGTTPTASPEAASHADTRSAVAPVETSAVERMQSMIETPAPASSRHSITVKVAGEAGDANIDLRFIDRGGDIHLSVRTPSTEAAQELRGGLSDLVGRLEHAGIRTEISNPSANGSGLSDSSKDQEQASADRRGSGRNQADTESQQQDSRGSNRSRWIEALEGSPNFSQEQSI